MLRGRVLRRPLHCAAGLPPPATARLLAPSVPAAVRSWSTLSSPYVSSTPSPPRPPLKSRVPTLSTPGAPAHVGGVSTLRRTPPARDAGRPVRIRPTPTPLRARPRAVPVVRTPSCMPSTYLMHLTHTTTTAAAAGGGQQLPENYAALARELRKFLREDQVVLAVATPFWFRLRARPTSAAQWMPLSPQWWARRAGERSAAHAGLRDGRIFLPPHPQAGGAGRTRRRGLFPPRSKRPFVVCALTVGGGGGEM
jgi:hypothetical protein